MSYMACLMYLLVDISFAGAVGIPVTHVGGYSRLLHMKLQSLKLKFARTF